MKWWGGTLLWFWSATSVAALTINFSLPSSSINVDQDITVDINLDCGGCKDSYLRGVFYKSGTNYFGQTQNDLGQWISTSADKTQYFHVDSASWSGQLKVKPDTTDSKYQGPGSYFFKVGRYTGGGSATWAEAVTVNIVGPEISPTPTPTPTPAPSPVPAKTPLPTRVEDVKVLVSTSDSAGPSAEVWADTPVLVETDQTIPSSPQVLAAKTEEGSGLTNIWGLVIAALGGLMCVAATVLAIHRYKEVVTINQ